MTDVCLTVEQLLPPLASPGPDAKGKTLVAFVLQHAAGYVL